MQTNTALNSLEAFLLLLLLESDEGCQPMHAYLIILTLTIFWMFEYYWVLVFVALGQGLYDMLCLDISIYFNNLTWWLFKLFNFKILKKNIYWFFHIFQNALLIFLDYFSSNFSHQVQSSFPQNLWASFPIRFLC